MSGRHEREARKAELLNQIQQQRLDLSAARRDWLTATAQYDRGWTTLVSLRRWVTVGSSLLAIWSVRKKPRKTRKSHFVLRWAKHGIGMWSSYRLLRKSLTSR